MPKATKTTEGGKVLFWCPGCDEAHGVNTDPGQGGRPCWGWNNSLAAPTFTPSVLVRSVRPIQGGKPVRDNKYEGPYPPPEGSFAFVCHSFVTDGRIQFLCDSSHDLAGQTVDLPDWE